MLCGQPKAQADWTKHKELHMHYGVIDIGSPSKGNLGWSVIGPEVDTGGTDPDLLIEILETAARRGPLILGFEAPMYVPAGREVSALLKGRLGEGSRAWSVAAGATTTAIALAIVPWVLDCLSKRIDGMLAWQDWTRRPTAPGELLVFEAFVSGGPSDGHMADARAAALAAKLAFEGADLQIASALAHEDCMSLLGAALLHARLTDDISELHRRCLVIRAAKVVTPSVKRKRIRVGTATN
jgi:hypothetical protein